MASRVPRYHQIAQTLRERIVAGGHGPGQRLDNQRSLAREFGVTLMTLHSAKGLEFPITVVSGLTTEPIGRLANAVVWHNGTWTIASKQRSSTTREYIGAVVDIDDLREGRGDFDTPEAFYKFWRRYGFKIGKVVQQQLDKLLAGQDS